MKFHRMTDGFVEIADRFSLVVLSEEYPIVTPVDCREWFHRLPPEALSSVIEHVVLCMY